MTLNGVHHKAIGLSLAGKTQPEIATGVGVSERTVARWFADDDFVAELKAQGLKMFGPLVGAAIATLELLMEHGDPCSVRLRAAQDILDRAGLLPVEKCEISGPDGGPEIHKVTIHVVTDGDE